MLKMILAELGHRPGRTLALLLGVLVAATSFTVLTGASGAQRLDVRGTVDARFRTTYDVLVRPAGTATPLERDEGLVQRNFLSGIFGGISLAQLAVVRRTPGVDVAAPIGVGGYVMPQASIRIRVPRGPGGRELYRVRTTWSFERGLSRVRDADSYVYATPNRLAPAVGVEVTDDTPGAFEVLPNGERAPVCPSDDKVQATSPFEPLVRMRVECWSRVNGLQGLGGANGPEDYDADQLGATVDFPFPFVIAAVDPEAEARLSGLDAAVTDGRYLRGRDGPRDLKPRGLSSRRRVIPVIVSQRPFVDLGAKVAVQRLSASGAARVARAARTARFRRLLASQRPGAVVARRRLTVDDAYRTLLGQLHGYVGVDAIWTAGAIRYDRAGRRAVAPRPVANDPSVWSTTLGYNNASFANVPLSASDVGFRRLDERTADNGLDHPFPALRSVGAFDPARIPGFARPDAAALSTYTPPTATAADATARRLLGDRGLLPNGSAAGYLTSPPLLLTTFAGLSVLYDETLFDDAGPQAGAPVSVIRVRVAGVKGVDELSRERIRLVAQRIARRTGLRVDITAGSSPTPVDVRLPTGRFGRPALTVQEGWIKKGVAVSILRAIDRKSLALFVLILLVCALFTTNAAAAAVRSRRSELAVLATLGWPARRLFALVLLEVSLVGAAAGVAAAALSIPVAALAGLHAAWDRALLAIPAATLLTALAALWPARAAARSHPAEAIRPAVSVAGAPRPVRTLPQMALTNLTRVRGRTLLAAAALAVGVFSLTALVGLTLAFRGAVVGTLLGDAVAVQVRAADYVAVGAILLLGALAVGDVTYLNIRDRASELATLRAAGWPERKLRRLLTLEGAGTGALGALAGAALGVVATTAFASGHLLVIVASALTCACAGVIAAVVATVPPVATLARLPTAQLLAEEDG